MPVATVRGVDLNYEILGERGPWVALQPGGRRGLEGVKPLGEKLAEARHLASRNDSAPRRASAQNQTLTGPPRGVA